MSQKQKRAKQPWIAAVLPIFFGGIGCFYLGWQYGLIGSLLWVIAFAWAGDANFWLLFLVQVGLGIVAFKMCSARQTKVQAEYVESILQPQLSTLPGTAKPGVRAASSPLGRVVKFTCVWVAIDAFFLNQGILTGVIVLAAIAYMPFAIWALIRKNNALFRIRSAQIGIVLAGCLSVFGLNWFQNKCADEKAVELGNACLAYHVKYNRYPKYLQEIAPEFVPSIPPAKYALISSSFSYCFTAAGEPEIYYVEMPPFGRRFYHVETGKWGYLD